MILWASCPPDDRYWIWILLPFQVCALGCWIIIYFFKIHFGSKKFNSWILGNKNRQLLWQISGIWTFKNNETSYNIFYTSFLRKWGDTIFHPNYRTQNCCDLFNTCSTGGLASRKRLPSLHQSLYFALPCNFLEFWHFKQIISKKFYSFKNNLINAELEKVLW
jgi:hypothetical protein